MATPLSPTRDAKIGSKRKEPSQYRGGMTDWMILADVLAKRRVRFGHLTQRWFGRSYPHDAIGLQLPFSRSEPCDEANLNGKVSGSEKIPNRMGLC